MVSKIPIIRTGRRKTCTMCGELKFLKDFYRSSNKRNHPDGYDHICKECRKKSKRESYARTRKKPEGIFVRDGRTVERRGGHVRIYWGEEKLKDFKRKFPTHTNEELAIDFGCSERTITRHARELGLVKDPVWLKSVHAVSLQRMIRHQKACPKYNREALLAAGMSYRFKKGEDNKLSHKQRVEAAMKAWETRRRKMRSDQHIQSN